MRLAGASLVCCGAILWCAAGVRADVVEPWDEIPSGLCPQGTRQSMHGGQCIVHECGRASPESRCTRISLCVSETRGRLDRPYLVARRTCGTQSDCPAASDCRMLDVVAERDPPVVQLGLGCCALFLVVGAAATFLLARARARRRAARIDASASRDGRVG